MHRTPMSRSLEITPLLGISSHRQTCWPALLYAVIFCFCFGCSFIPLVPTRSFEIILSPDVASLLRSGLVTDLLQDVLWVQVRLVLQDSAYQGACCGSSQSERRIIRKADSLGVVLKGCALKLPATATTTWLSLGQTGLPVWLCVLLSSALLAILALNAIYITSPLALEIQVRKAARDDAVEAALWTADDNQSQYMAVMKTWGVFFFIRRVIIGFLLCVLYLYGGSPVTVLRLAHHVFSIDDACEKMAQSAPKASHIIRLARRLRSTTSVLQIASRRVMLGRPTLLADMPHFPSLHVKFRSWLSFRIEKDKGRGDRQDQEFKANRAVNVNQVIS
ncbi:hypothetical protein F5B18DRAFT_638741 [Nemania serpens]|nr:hypothetical protein F5B18DRAFT_638741 [Nemania serpens]